MRSNYRLFHFFCVHKEGSQEHIDFFLNVRQILEMV